MGSQNFLNGLALFKLLNVDETAEVQHIIDLAREQSNNMDYSKITTLLIQKLYNESSIYHKKIKYFFGYYEELKSMYYIWDSLGRTLKL